MGDYEASRGHIGTGYNAEEVSHILSDFRNADFLYAVRARPSPCCFLWAVQGCDRTRRVLIEYFFNFAVSWQEICGSMDA